MARGAASIGGLAAWLLPAVVAAITLSGASANEDGFLKGIEARVNRLKHDRTLDFVAPQCGSGALVVLHGGPVPKIEDVRSHAPPLAKFATEQVEYVHVSEASCLAGLTAVQNDFLIFDDGGLGDIDFLSSLASIGGHLIIWGSGTSEGPQITSFAGLQNLQAIGKSLNVVNMEAITNFEGLGRLTQIGGDLLVWNNGLLENFLGLGPITEVHKTLYIDNNLSMKDLAGLESIQEIGFDLLLKGNRMLKDFSALSNLNTVWNSIMIQNMEGLENFSFLQNLQRLGNGIDIYANPLIKDLTGFEGLTEVKGDIVLVANGLQSTRGLQNVQAVGMNLVISQHWALTDLSGLGSVQSVGGLLSIADNQVLATCEGLGSVAEIGQDLFVQRNAALTTLQGLVVQRVGTTLGGNLVVQANPKLTSLGGLPQTLQEVRGGVRIAGNSPGLPRPEVEAVMATALESE